jgi:hypothetical protein
MSTSITCWLNTSATKASLWFAPTGGQPVSGSIFINGLASADRDELVQVLRDCFGRVSVKADIPIDAIQTTKSGSLATVAFTADDLFGFIDGAIERASAPKVASPGVSERASALRGRLDAMPKASAKASTAPAGDNDPFAGIDEG